MTSLRNLPSFAAAANASIPLLLFLPTLASLPFASAAGAFTFPGEPEQFDIREVTVDGIHNALFTGLTTCRHVISAFISRIEAVNPVINAVTALSPDALDVADSIDVRLASGNVTVSLQPLFCVPILLKDNFDAVGLNTTAGCLALAENRPAVDAPTVRALRDAGAVILGKASMHELALEGISVSSLGGQVVNPFDLGRTPGGSSGGSGAAVAAGLAVLATGTDTVNSLRSPANANGLFSVRPTRGLLSRAGVVPVSHTQDAVGCMGRTVADVAAALTVMARVGYDPADNATALAPREVLGRDYVVESLRWRSGRADLRGLRVGVLEGLFNRTASPETTPVNDAVGRVVSLLERAGAAVVNVADAVYDAAGLAARLDVQRFEYRELLDGYLAGPNLTGAVPRSFRELYFPTPAPGNGGGGGRDFLVLPSQYEYIATAAVSSTSNAAWLARQRGIEELRRTLHATFARHRFDAVLYPEQQNLVVEIGSASQAGRNGILAALTGFPVVAAPAGLSPPTAAAPFGVPVGVELLGPPWSEPTLLGLARRLAELVGPAARRVPPFANATVEAREYAAVPSIAPNRRNIPAAYPIGALG